LGTSPTETGNTTEISETPSRVTLIQDTVTQAVSLTTDGNGARFYNPEDGRFYRVLADGNIDRLGDKQFFNVENVSWGNKSDRAVLEFPDGRNVIYDFDSSRQTTLPQHWADFEFSPNDENIISKSVGLDERSRFLIVTNANGGEARAIESIGSNQDLIHSSWSPNNQIVAYSLTGNPQPDGAQQVFFVGENHENFKSLIAPGRGFIPNWSPTGKQILFSVYHERTDLKPEIWIAGGSGDDIGENRRSLKLNTWADKCVWEDETAIICGVPQSLDFGAGLAPQNFRSNPDDVYRIDLKSGIASKISTPDQIFPIRQPILPSDKSKLIFTNAVTGRLYEYEL
ncbi:MAG: hypothetical protein NUV81_00400, partial [bacterium]|nr:hypothetical protein [bacterium]